MVKRGESKNIYFPEKLLVMRREAEAWLKQSYADLKTAKDCFEDENYYATAFFCQQAVEKALKAMYIIVRKDYPLRTHNLLELAREVYADEKILKIARELTPEFVISRYPDAANGIPAELYDRDKAERILLMTEEFFKWLKEKLKNFSEK